MTIAIQQPKVKTTTRLLICFIIALLFACSSANDDSGKVTHDGKNLLVHFVTPAALTGSLIQDLKANIVINNASPIELLVNPDNTISGTISNVTPGEHDLLITYYVVLSSLPTSLATVKKSVTIVAGETTQVTITDGDLDKNIDADSDGYTNLAELNIGTDPNNRNDMPGGELILFTVANGSYGHSVSSNNEMKSRVGEPLNGIKKSANYTVVNGFRAY